MERSSSLLLFLLLFGESKLSCSWRPSTCGCILKRKFCSSTSRLRANAAIAPSTASSQWDLFCEQHVGQWRGLWETYDVLGDKIDVTEAMFTAALQPNDQSGVAALSQTFNIATIKADCETCHDSSEEKTMNLGMLTRDTLAPRRTVLLGPAMVSGPTVLRSGIMSTELALRFGDGRLRVTFQHAPAWDKNSEAGVGPPDVLDLLRVTVRREALRPFAPTPESESAEAAAASSARRAGGATAPRPQFWRGVPPFRWAEQEGGPWRGTRFAFDASGDAGGGQREQPTDEAGDSAVALQGTESVLDFDAPEDVWHERYAGDDENVWHLRLPGGVLVQCAQRLFNDKAGEGLYDDGTLLPEAYRLRLAWLAEDTTLLRATASVTALASVTDESDLSVRIEPPALKSLVVDEHTKDPAVDQSAAALT